MFPVVPAKYMLCGTAGPFISLGNGQKIAENLKVPLMFIPNQGHFNASAGYTKFPLLLEKIKESI